MDGLDHAPNSLVRFCRVVRAADLRLAGCAPLTATVTVATVWPGSDRQAGGSAVSGFRIESFALTTSESLAVISVTVVHFFRPDLDDEDPNLFGTFK